MQTTLYHAALIIIHTANRLIIYNYFVFVVTIILLGLRLGEWISLCSGEGVSGKVSIGLGHTNFPFPVLKKPQHSCEHAIL